MAEGPRSHVSARRAPNALTNFMFHTVKQVRAAVSLVRPEAVRALACQRITIGLVAASRGGYAELEDFLIPPGAPHETRFEPMNTLYRAGDPGTPEHVDLVLYEHGLPCPHGAFPYRRADPQSTVAEILRTKEELALPLARQYPVFRRAVVERTIHAVACENALFAVVTSLPNAVPSLFELPWAVGEFASDTAFLTVNQIRMAFMIAAACGKEIGFVHQKAEMLSIAAGAFGWRALARELVGKIPLGGGIIPKGAIAFAGTFLVGKGLEAYHHARAPLTKAERDEVYEEAYERGKMVAESFSKESARLR
jgi:hypothetical protein